MTINIVAATYDAVVLGCDSLSSYAEQAIFPFRHGVSPAVDAEGTPMSDAAGNPVFSAKPDLPFVATGVMGGIRKMFILLEDDACDCSVAGVTSGMGALNGVTIAEIASRYRRQVKAEGLCFTEVEEMLRHFLAHMRGLWEQHKSAFPWAGPLSFLAAGYCKDDSYTKVFRVSVHENDIREQFPTTSHPENCGIAWDGQSAYASRVVMGVSGDLQQKVSRAIIDTLTAQRTSIVESIFRALAEAGVDVPEGLSIEFQEVVPSSLPWAAAQAPIDFRNIPIQTAIEFVAALVNTESGMHKFVMGVPTVGGRTRIGLLRRNVPFDMLNEPALAHVHTGYVTDA